MKPDLIARHPGLLLAVHACAFWPVWRWYAARMNDGSDEPWALAALAAAAFVSWPRRGFRLDARDTLLGGAAALTLVYAAAATFAPPLVRAALAMGALACTWASVAGARAKLPVVLALLVLSVPVIASLQFYLGYPLRVATAAGATALLDLAGFDIVRAGTSMSLGGRMVLVDAPCSGVRMWWTASVLCCVLAAQRARLTSGGLLLAGMLAVPAVLAANSLRAALLFVLETRATPPAPHWHSIVGIAGFGLLALLLVASEAVQHRWLARFAPPRLAVRA